MTRITKKDRIDRYSSWINVGKQHLDIYSKDWSRWEKYMDTPHMFPDNGDAGVKSYRLSYNIIWMNIKLLLGLLAHGTPFPMVTALKENSDKSAKLMETALSYFSRISDLKLEMRMCILDVLLYNVSFFKQGYFADFRGIDEAEKKKGPAATLRKAMEQDMNLEEIEKKIIGRIEDHDDSAELFLEEVPGSESWWGERVDPKNIYVPPTCAHKLDRAPWMIQRILRPSYDTIRLFPEVHQYTPSHTINFGNEIDDAQTINVDAFEIFEIWDKSDPEEKKVAYMVGSKVDDERVEYHLMKEIEWIPGLSGFPYSCLRINRSPKKFYLPPDLFMYEHFAQALSEIVSNHLGSMRKFRRYIGYNSEMKRAAAEAVAHGPDGTTFMTEKQDDIWEFKTQQPNLDFGFYNTVERLVNQASGVDEFFRASSSRAETATEASQIREGSQLRMDDMMSAIHEFGDDIYTKAGCLLQAYLTGPLSIKIAPEEQKMYGSATPWVNLKNDDIQGKFIYKIKAGTLTRETNEGRKRKFFDFYNLAYQDPYFNPIELRKIVVENYFDKTIDPMDLLKVGMMGQTEQAIMLEHKIAMMGQQIPPPNEQEDHESHLEAHEGFIKNPPEEIKMQMAAAQNAAGQAPRDPQSGQPQAEARGPIDEQLQAVMGKWQGVSQILQQHIQETQAILQEAAQPLDVNRAKEKGNERSERPEQPRTPETTIQVGG